MVISETENQQFDAVILSSPVALADAPLRYQVSNTEEVIVDDDFAENAIKELTGLNSFSMYSYRRQKKVKTRIDMNCHFTPLRLT